MRLIDADALWERLDNEPWENNADRDEIALPFVDAAPTIDAEIVVHGRWEEYLIPNILCCSNCDWGIDPLCKSPYCPNCGAKMESEEG